jgi:hypothetical protein
VVDSCPAIQSTKARQEVRRRWGSGSAAGDISERGGLDLLICYCQAGQSSIYDYSVHWTHPGRRWKYVVVIIHILWSLTRIRFPDVVGVEIRILGWSLSESFP